MPSGYCVLFIARVGAFYSKLFDLKSHPNYSELYEPWAKNIEKMNSFEKTVYFFNFL